MYQKDEEKRELIARHENAGDPVLVFFLLKDYLQNKNGEVEEGYELGGFLHVVILTKLWIRGSFGMAEVG